MELEELENKYDFTESTVHDMYWENHFKDLVLVVNYYWGSAGVGPAKHDQFLCLRFINCREVSFVNDAASFKLVDKPDSEDFNRKPVITIIGWGDVRKVDTIRPSLQSPEDPDELHIGFQSMNNPAPVYWLEVICSEMEVVDWFIEEIDTKDLEATQLNALS